MEKFRSKKFSMQKFSRDFFPEMRKFLTNKNQWENFPDEKFSEMKNFSIKNFSVFPRWKNFKRKIFQPEFF